MIFYYFFPQGHPSGYLSPFYSPNCLPCGGASNIWKIYFKVFLFFDQDNYLQIACIPSRTASGGSPPPLA
jgi:hypothetical protein